MKSSLRIERPSPLANCAGNWDVDLKAPVVDCQHLCNFESIYSGVLWLGYRRSSDAETRPEEEKRYYLRLRSVFNKIAIE